MKKKNRLAIILVILLGALATWLVLKNDGSTLKVELKDFAVKDTAAISRIFIKDKANKEVNLERNGPGEWTLDGKYSARNDLMNNLLETIRNIQVRNLIGNRAIDNTTKNLAAGGTKVEIYQNGELAKVYYVGGETPDTEGTYMLMHDHKTGKNSSVPFVVHLPGFSGYLTPRYSTNANDWREKLLFKYDQNSIKSVNVEYKRSPQHSFTVNLEGDMNVSVLDHTGKPVPNIDSVQARKYLSYYGRINYEAIAPLRTELKDSVLKNGPVHIITVTGKDGKKRILSTYAKPPLKEEVSQDGKRITEDVDRMFATIDNNNGEIVLVQYYVIGKLFPQPSYFLKGKENVKK
jgi:hypothetical protein